MTNASTGLAWSATGPLDQAHADFERAVHEGLPDHVQLRHPHSVWEQRDVPCCVSCAVTTAMEVLDARRGRSLRLSPLFNYFLTRPNSATLGDIAIVRALASAVTDGVAPFIDHAPPFAEAGAKHRPSIAALAAAKRHRLAPKSQWGGLVTEWPYRPVESSEVEAWKRWLAAGFPLILGFGLGRNAAKLEQPEETILRGLDLDAKGHAVVVLGYDDHALGPEHGAFRVKDSRGPRIGRRGTWWIPYPLVREGIARELWIVTAISYDV